MTRLLRVDVTPLNGQVEMSDPKAADYPQWQTGEERAVALPQSIAVATQGDADGKVAIEVWTDDLEVAGVDLRSVHEGEFLLTDDHAVVGNTVVNELHPVPLAPEPHRVKVFTSGAESAPSAVYFLIED
jgi:hypothetical protein